MFLSFPSRAVKRPARYNYDDDDDDDDDIVAEADTVGETKDIPKKEGRLNKKGKSVVDYYPGLSAPGPHQLDSYQNLSLS